MGSVVLSSTYSTSMTGSMTCNMKITYSETWNASTRKTTVKITGIAIQKVSNGANWGSMTLRGSITCNGTTLVNFGGGSASVTISLSGSSYCSVSGFSSSTVAISHDASGAATATFKAVQYQSMAIIGAYYSSGVSFGVKTQSKSVSLTNRGALTYTVSYNANGHGTAPSSQTKTYNVALTLRSFISVSSETGTVTTFTITGNANGGSWSGSNGKATRRPIISYRQTYWNTKTDGTGTNYDSGGSYTANASLTLYAIWSSSTAYGYTYTLPTGTPSKNENAKVTFNANGGSTTKSSQLGSRPREFLGWFTAADGGTQRTTSSIVGADETVYAHYGSGSGDYSSVTLPTAAQCTRSGYTLLGFSTSSSSTVADYAPGASYTPTAAITLYAVWKALGSVRISNGASFDTYLIYIDNGSGWDQYAPYIDSGSGWELYG